MDMKVDTVGKHKNMRMVSLETKTGSLRAHLNGIQRWLFISQYNEVESSAIRLLENKENQSKAVMWKDILCLNMNISGSGFKKKIKILQRLESTDNFKIFLSICRYFRDLCLSNVLLTWPFRPFFAHVAWLLFSFNSLPSQSTVTVRELQTP